MTEKDLQESIIELAGWLGWTCYHTHDSRRSRPGFPDLVLWRGSRLLFVELKSATGRLSVAQEQTLDELAETPAEVYIWRPSSWDQGDIAELLG